MDLALKTMIDNMPEKTGKSLEEWKKILTDKNFSKHSEALKYLKAEHGVTHGYANTIITLSKQQDIEPNDLVKKQYEGREQLKPIYEKIINAVNSFGEDVEIAPKKTTVSLRRNVQFALIKPATKSRIDLGLKLKGKKTTDRLEDSGPFGTMCTHRVRLSESGQVDEQLVKWLKEAYANAG